MNVARLVRTAVRCGALVAVPALAVAGLGTPARAEVAPTVAVTSLVDGASVHGTVTVTATGTTGDTDAAQIVDLYVDDVLLTDFACDGQDPTVCDASFDWDTTLLSGTHTVRASLTTTGGVVVEGPVLTVTADNPAPTLSTSGPAAGAVVHGDVTVTATGGTEPAASDVPDQIELLLDGTAVTSDLCGGVDPHTCTLSLAVDTTALFGRHTLGVRLTTTGGRTVTRTSDVWVSSGTATTLAVAGPVRPGAAVVLRGRVTATANRAAVAGAGVRLTLAPAVGSARTLTVRTSATGDWAATVYPGTTTKVTAAVLATPRYGASSRTAVQLVRAPIVTRLSSTTTRRNVAVRGTATVRYLPTGTRVALQAYYGGGWHTIASGTAAGSTFGFRVWFSTRGTYSVRVVTAANRVWTTTYGAAVRLTVR